MPAMRAPVMSTPLHPPLLGRSLPPARSSGTRPQAGLGLPDEMIYKTQTGAGLICTHTENSGRGFDEVGSTEGLSARCGALRTGRGGCQQPRGSANTWEWPAWEGSGVVANRSLQNCQQEGDWGLAAGRSQVTATYSSRPPPQGEGRAAPEGSGSSSGCPC